MCQTLFLATKGVERSHSPVGENADRKPDWCSSASGEAVRPASARRAARTPDCAARPTWKHLVRLPKLATRPPAIDAAMAKAVWDCWALRRRSLAQAAAAA